MNERIPLRERRVAIVLLKAIVLASLMCAPWSAAAAPPDVEPSDAPGIHFEPLPEERCRELAERVGDALAREVVIDEVPFLDPVSSGRGRACRAVATGPGEDFGSFLDVAERLREVLVRAGWQEDERYLADGPTGTATAFRFDDARVLVNVGWTPAEGADCPDDRPIFACDVAPAHQSFEITVTAVRKRPAGTAPADGDVSHSVPRPDADCPPDSGGARGVAQPPT